MMGIELQRISLGALILSLGLLVDDAIIAIETMVVKLEQGWDRVRAASFAWTSTAFPMLTGTLVTAAGFLPVGIAKSTVRRICRRHLLGRRHRPARELGRRRRSSRPISASSLLARTQGASRPRGACSRHPPLPACPQPGRLVR
jgi:hypothetical protein